MTAHFPHLLLLVVTESSRFYFFFELSAPIGQLGASAYNGRRKFPNKTGIYGSYGIGSKYYPLE
jgi:hypothetical protein